MSLRTVLIGLDGATFTLLNPLMQDGTMPVLRGLVNSGVHAELHSVVPPLTPPAWTSLVTGRSPGQHGVFDFFVKVEPDSPHIRFATSNDVGVETIWSMASRQDKRVTVLNFPLMFPPPSINGYSVPGWMPWRQLRLGCHPPSLFERLKGMADFNARELAMDMGLEEKAIEGCPPQEYEDWIALHIRREKQWFRILSMLMRQEPCELTAVLFDGPDKLQHLFWRFLDRTYLLPPPASLPTLGGTEGGRRIRQLCRGYFRELDRIVGEIVALAGSEATVVLASDHGFGAQTGTFFVNSWLQERGYLTWADQKAPLTSSHEELGIGQLARHVYQLDWERTRAYAPTPSGNGVHIVTTAPGRENGVPQADYAAFRDQLRGELLAVKDPATGDPVVSRVWTREEVFAGPYQELAPDLTLELNDGGLVSILGSDAHYKPRAEPSGTHRPEGILIASGPCLRERRELPPLSILDVAPLLLYSLGLPVPDDLEGRVPIEAIEPAVLQKRPVRTAQPPPPTSPSSWGGIEGEEPGPVLDAEAQAEILRRMRALGYME